MQNAKLRKGFDAKASKPNFYCNNKKGRTFRVVP